MCGAVRPPSSFIIYIETRKRERERDRGGERETETGMKRERKETFCRLHSLVSHTDHVTIKFDLPKYTLRPHKPHFSIIETASATSLPQNKLMIFKSIHIFF